MTYGVTWATAFHPVAQTGYVFTEEEAVSVAKAHPSVIADAYPDIQIDAMCEHYPAVEGGALYGRVETAEDSHGTYEVLPKG